MPCRRSLTAWPNPKPNPDPTKRRMATGEVLAILPGGFEEASLAQPGKDRVYIKKRAGFLKYALQNGYKVFPVYTFGEVDTYSTIGGGFELRHALNKYGIPTVLFMGFLGIFPRCDVQLHTVIGEAVQLPKMPECTEDDVEKYHLQYIEALTKVFDNNKGKYAPEGAKLEIW